MPIRAAAPLAPTPNAHSAAGWVVLALPRGKLTLKERLVIKRSNLVLRGAGPGQTVLYIPKSERRWAALATQVVCGAARCAGALLDRRGARLCSARGAAARVLGRHAQAGMPGATGAPLLPAWRAPLQA